MSGSPKPSLDKRELDRMASQAWDAYAALQRTQMREPDLADNEYWQALKDTAYARLRALMGSETPK